MENATASYHSQTTDLAPNALAPATSNPDSVCRTHARGDCAVSVLSAILATQHARRQIEQQLQGIAGTLVSSTFPLTDGVLRQMHGLSGADFLLTDTADRIVAASRPIELPISEVAAANEPNQLRLGPPVTIDGQSYFQMAMAMLPRGNRDAGQLMILYPEQFWIEARSEAAVPPLVVGAAALSATVALAFLVAGRLSRPILELRRQVVRIAKADYVPMPLPARNDELRDLAETVNRLTEQLSQMENAIRRSERLAILGQLAGGLAHQLRNNVTGALMAVQLHAHGCQSDPESLQVAKRQLALTEENLKQFLAAPQSSVDPAADFRFKICRPEDIAQQAIELVGPSFKHRHIDLAFVNLTHEAAALSADSTQLRHVLTNLLLNAGEAAGTGGVVKLEIEETPQREIAYRIIDNGPGPSPEMVKRLFEPFATNKPEGVGLGLAVARQIAEGHGGRIVFQRTGGETCFEVALPVVNQANSAASSRADRIPASTI